MKRSFWILMAFLILMSSGTCTRAPLKEDANVQVLAIYPAGDGNSYIIPALKSVYDVGFYKNYDTLLFIHSNSEAEIQSIEKIPLSSRPYIENIYHLPNGNFLFTGSINDEYFSFRNSFLEISPEARIISKETFPDNVTGLCPGNDGSMFFFGRKSSDGFSDTLFYLKKDAAANTLWTRNLDIEASFHNIISGVATQDNGCIALGTIMKDTYSNDMYALRINAEGDTLWTGIFGGDRDDYLQDALELPDASCLLLGTIDLYDSGNPDWSLNYGRQVYLVRISSDGEKIWTLPLGKTLRESPHSLILHSNGNYILAGNRDESYAYLYDKPLAWVAAVTPDAKLLWMREFESRIAGGITELPSGEILFISSAINGSVFNNYLPNFYMTKIDASGTVVLEQTLTP